jgi:tetratricopeptide (TPR) repeat protein
MKYFDPRSDRSALSRLFWLAAIAVSIALGLAFRWVNFTLDRDLYGFAFSVRGYSPGHPAFVLSSFGAVALLILLGAAVAVALDNLSLQGWFGALLLVLMFWAYLQVAVGDSRLLLALARQSDWWLIIAGHPPPVARTEPGIWPQLGFDTLMDRLFSGWYCLGLGWYVDVAAGLVLLFSALVSRTATCSFAILASVGISCIALAVGFLFRPVLAERAFIAALNFETTGDLSKAKAQYRKAMVLDPWYGLNPQLYERIGRSDEGLGRTQSFEYRFYQAEMIFDHDQGAGSIWQLELAINECDRIATTAGAIAEAAKARSTDMRVLYGLHLFEAGSFGSAVAAWTGVLSREPDNWLAAYYLTLGYPTINGYRDLAKISERFLAKCGDPLTIGLFYDSLGKAQIHLNLLDEGHASYYDSYKRDYINNNNAVHSLIGP